LISQLVIDILKKPMPGLIGFKNEFSKIQSEELIEKMVCQIFNYKNLKVDIYSDEGIGLGRVGLDRLDPFSQPAWNVDETICAIIEGEIYSEDGLQTHLIQSGKVIDDAKKILYYYEKYGDGFAAHLNGAYVAAIWNCKEKKLILINDHLGLRPLYYANYKNKFIFSSSIQAMLEDSDLSRNIDHTAIAQMLCFEYVLGERTLLEEVHLLPPASICIYYQNHLTINKYCNIKYSESFQIKSTEEYLEELIFFLRQAVSRQMPGDLHAGVNLSGGFDSRLLLGLLSEYPLKEPLFSYTFGLPNCADVKYAKEIANEVGTAHRFFELKPDFLIKLVNEAVINSNGLESSVYIHAMAQIERQSKEVDVVYSGFLIDSLINQDIKREWWANYSTDDAINFLYKDINANELFQNPNVDEIFSLELKRKVSNSFDEIFRETVKTYRAPQLADWHDNMDINQRQRRFTNNGNDLLRSHVICRTPFCDKDLVEFTMKLPPGLRSERYLIIKALEKCFHELAKIPYDRTGFPFTPCLRNSRLEFNQQIEWQLKKIGLPVNLNKIDHDYFDYNKWLRNDLRVWVEDLLLDKRTLERGYFNPNVVRKLVSEHMAGSNNSRKLGVLITLELWHRLVLD
jgi:asparagine synthase (glutamine-hydrolysing)